MADKPRILQGGRDMIWTMVPLLLLCAFVLFVSGNCSIGINGPAQDDKVPAFDVAGSLQADARTMPFPIRRPPTPEGWKPNSGSTQPVGDSRVSNAGWVTKAGAYIQLSQTGASEDALVRHLGSDAMGSGIKDIGGHRWVMYTVPDGKKFWITDLGDVRIAVVSRGPDGDMTVLANSVLAQEPLKV